jgi:hypothetical protein
MYAFTWDDGIFDTSPDGLYVVAFLSIRNLDSHPSSIDRLLQLDHDAFEEARKMPGFGTYWHDDDLAPDGRGLSFCLWQSKEQARKAAAQPKHQAAVAYAMGEGRGVYRHYSVGGHHLHKTEGGLLFIPAVMRRPEVAGAHHSHG